jgi:putative transposase
MRLMGLEAIYPKPRLSAPTAGHRIYPYLLRNVTIKRPDQVWSTDITSIPLRGGFVYLVAILDGYSRYVLASDKRHNVRQAWFGQDNARCALGDIGRGADSDADLCLGRAC